MAQRATIVMARAASAATKAVMTSGFCHVAGVGSPSPDSGRGYRLVGAPELGGRHDTQDVALCVEDRYGRNGLVA